MTEQISAIVTHRRATLQVKQTEQAAEVKTPEEEPVVRLLNRIKEFFSI